MDLELFADSPNGHLVPLRGVDGRTGRSYDHMGFAPNPLGPQVELSQKSWNAVARANRALGRLDQASLQIPNPALLRRPTLRREAQSTSALEGTFAPLDRVLADDEEGEGHDDATGLAAVTEVLNYVRAAQHAFLHVENGCGITVGMLREAQHILVAGTHAATTDPGSIRSIPVAIGDDAISLERARFVPMPPGTSLEAAVQDLVDWINSGHQNDPVIAAAMAHYQFEALHPFIDGNGRIGRLLIVLHLMANDELRMPLLSVSPWFEERRNEYQQYLFNVSARGDWDSWVGFFSAGLEESASDTRHRVEALLELDRNYQDQIKQAEVKSGIARDIAAKLIGYPSFTIPSMTKRLQGATPQAVSNAAKKLVELGILERHERRYRHRYIAPRVMEVLSSEGIPDS